jgi:hypothetical protein
MEEKGRENERGMVGGVSLIITCGLDSRSREIVSFTIRGR